jgi:hypothetical protein
VKRIKTFKLFESVSEKTVREKLYDITDNDDNFNINIHISWEKSELEVIITRGSYLDVRNIREIPGAPVPPGGGYPAISFLWFEIKDTIIGLCEYVYSETEFTPGINSKQFTDIPFRMFNGGIEFGVGWHKEEDFILGDFISFTSLNIIIKL